MRVVKMFYAQPEEEPLMVVVRMIEELLTDRYNGCCFYVHNLARFDSRFILEGLGYMNNVKVSLLGRDMNQIFKIKISRKIGKKSINVVFLDSYYQLPFKLETLAIKFNTETKKGIFPYRFVNKYNLFYKGAVPAKKFYEGHVDNETYSNLCQCGV